MPPTPPKDARESHPWPENEGRGAAAPGEPLLVVGRLLLDPAHAPEPGWVRVEAGRIAEVGLGDPPRDASPRTVGGRDRIVTPAFVDAHAHLPQIDSVGCDGLELLEWLAGVIFPAETWWGRGAALRDASTAIRRMSEQGTVGAAVYLSSHAQPAAEVLSLLARTPMRWHAGRVAMDRAAPEALTAEDRARAAMRPAPSPIATTPEPAGRLRVSANPRFAISCSDELLAEVGWAVRDAAAVSPLRAPFVQTHLAESIAECREIARLFPGDASYTAVYDRFGLLGPRSLMAHCIHMSADEWALMRSRGAIAVHCPTANLFLRSGFFDLDAAERAGVRVALGSDVAGGPDVAMPRVARAMIETAKIRALTAGASQPAVRIPTPAEAWRLITRGNALALEWDDGGIIERGAAADLLVLRAPETWNDEHLVGRLIYNWQSDLIEHRVFQGLLADPSRLPVAS